MKSTSSIFNAITRGYWLIEPATAAMSHVRIKKFMENTSAFLKQHKTPEEVATSVRRYASLSVNGSIKMSQADPYFGNTPKGSIAVIHIRGTLMKEDFCDEPGMETIGKIIQEADLSENILGILMVNDSPGGTVDGTETLASIVAGTSKPLVSFVSGMSASASYWLSSQSNHIMMSGRTSWVGSIGVMLSVRDVRGAWEQQGVKFHNVISSYSPDKNKDYFDLLDGKYDTVRADLDQLANIFHESVKAGRPEIQKSAMTGKMYLAEQAISLGLADSIGTFEDAMVQVLTLAAER